MCAFVLKKITRRWGFEGLARIERHVFANPQTHYRPTFIVAPPRAGTTLTMQLIAWAIPTSYFSNLTWLSRLILGYPLPGTTAWLARWLPRTRYLRSFESDYGRTRGAAAPTDGEFIWNTLFESGNNAVDPNDVTPDQHREIYRAVAATERAFGLPFVNKTTVLSLRIRALVKMFPNALFIHVTRNPLDVAQSIFRARKSKYPNWLGPRPPQCEDVSNKTILEQVCEQVHYVEENIARERSAVGESRFLTVAYKDVCDRPLRELERIAAFMNHHGVPAAIIRAVPDSFDYSHGCKIDETDYLAMRGYLQKLAGSACHGIESGTTSSRDARG